MNIRITTDSCGEMPGLAIRAGLDACSLGRDADLRAAFGSCDAGEANIERLFSADTLCVTTGQQPGLLTGPIFTIYKALSATALARHLEEGLRKPVVPIFWVAGDDHDFAESNHCYVPSLSNDIVRLELRERKAGAPLTPMYREKIGEEIETVVDQLMAITPDTEFRAEVIDWIRTHYNPSSDMSSAFGGALAQLLGRFGLVVFSPTHIQAKRAMSTWIGTALENAVEIDSALRQRANELMEMGLPAPVAVGEGASTVLIESVLGRDRLLIDGDDFRTRRAKQLWKTEALVELAREEPERLSPNVLLRPVIEAAILPTVAYVAGPGEMAYLPQTAPIYDLLGVAPQIPLPRWSGGVVENRIAKILDKYNIGVSDLNLPEGQLEARVLKGEIPEAAIDALETLKRTMIREYTRLAESVSGVDATLEKPISAAQSGALRDVAAVEKRISRVLKQQNETTVRQLSSARNSLFPLGKPQERIVNITHFLIRYGTEFLDSVYDECLRWAEGLETVSGGA